jgi:transketolase C-terminal domain/subunit
MAEKILNNRIKTDLSSISLPDKFGPTGTYDYLLKYHGLNAENITKKIIKMVKKK